ncbi:MAG: hypothetical protein INR62_12695, partial [Rhodospirillales bacterium]|nr:hypothetical protein [Acetobacter sp.]
MNALAENLWTMQFPLTMLGAHINRTVTIIRLRSGKLVIHSTAPFSPGDVAAIGGLGEPGWLVEATNVHDTFAKEARAAFPGIPYFAPEDFSEHAEVPTQPLGSPPAEWAEELAVLELAGKAEAMREYVILHRPSRTLVQADLAFHVTSEASAGLRLYATAAMVGGKDHDTAMPRAERWGVRDKAAFERSLETMLRWDFERVVAGHGDVVETNRAALVEALREAGFL